MHDLAFADAVRPTPVRVLKLDLLEYSLGHEVTLLSKRNAFLLLDPLDFNELPVDKQIYALTTGVLACSQTWKQNQAPSKWLRIWEWRTQNTDWAMAIADFRNYLTAGRWLPRAPTKFACEVLYGKDDNDKGRVLGSPLVAQIYNWTRDSGLGTQDALWDISYSLAGTLYFAHLETEGRARVENEKEAEEQAALDKAEAEVAAEKAAVAKSPEATGLATPPPTL